ncbi:MAG: hypothetical protein ABIQ09_01670 [Jatrophihabitantaceae bacterium]
MINSALLKIGAGVTTLLAGGSVALLSPSSPAVAYSSPPLFLDVSIQSPAHLVAKGAAVTIPLTVICTAPSAPENFVDVQITQRSGNKVASGWDYAYLGCTGSRQQITITVSAASATRFSKGPAYVTARIVGCTDYFCGQEYNDATIQIVS